MVSLAAGDPPSLTIVKCAVNAQGITRHITQQVAVRNYALFQRLCPEVSKDDDLRLTLVTNLSAVDYRMTLVDFSRLTQAETASFSSPILAAHPA